MGFDWKLDKNNFAQLVTSSYVILQQHIHHCITVVLRTCKVHLDDLPIHIISAYLSNYYCELDLDQETHHFIICGTETVFSEFLDLGINNLINVAIQYLIGLCFDFNCRLNISSDG